MVLVYFFLLHSIFFIIVICFLFISKIKVLVLMDVHTREKSQRYHALLTFHALIHARGLNNR